MSRRAPSLLVAGVTLFAVAAPAAAATTARLDAEARAAVQASGHLWVLADRGGARVLIEADRMTGRVTGREVTIAASGVPRYAGVGQAQIRPSLTVAGGALWTTDPTTGEDAPA